MIRWRCACRASKHCPASAYTDLLPANPVLKADHNHCPEPVKIEVDRCRTEMRIHAAASNDPPAHIYAEKITGLTDAAKALLPSVDTCKRTISRNRIQEYPAEPASLLNLNILRPWTHVHKQHTGSLPTQQRTISVAWLLLINGSWMAILQWLHHNSCRST